MNGETILLNSSLSGVTELDNPSDRWHEEISFEYIVFIDDGIGDRFSGHWVLVDGDRDTSIALSLFEVIWKKMKLEHDVFANGW